MNKDIEFKIAKLHESVVGDILTLAEIGLQPEQFRQFKKKVFQIYHEKLKPETLRLLNSMHAKFVQQHLSSKDEPGDLS